jgi:hypothetical protein
MVVAFRPLGRVVGVNNLNSKRGQIYAALTISQRLQRPPHVVSGENRGLAPTPARTVSDIRFLVPR